MLREELIEKISKYFKLTDYEAEKIFDNIFHSIMEGVKNGNVVDLDNFGEFMIKQNGSNKSVEFLARQFLEDDLNSSRSPRAFQLETELPIAEFETSSATEPGEVSLFPPAEIDSSAIGVGDNKESIQELTESRRKSEPQEKSETPARDTSKDSSKYMSSDIEEDLKKKREAILSKLAAPEPEISRHAENRTDVPEDESKKSFSDYFSVVSAETSKDISAGEQEAEALQDDSSKEHTADLEEVRVIPPNVVELHKDIISNVPEREMVPEVGASAAEPQIQQQFVAEPDANGNPNHIWYKDSEPSPQETQTLPIEYELLYDAQKEAEHRSKLKIYVTSFILFFSFVLILLIFSPVIYKIFFNPQETQSVGTVQKENTEEISQQQNNAPQNSPPVTNIQTQETQQTPPLQETASNTEGLTKNGLGWTDEKYRVIYIVLDNNKYTIQESAWDSETKAANRLKTVEALKIAGLSGNIVKAELGEKGVWYRARFGEFSSLEEARNKAIELRDK